MKFLIINGPNINMLGIREPGIYGKENYEALLELCRKTGEDYGIEIECFQSNHEGAIVDKIQQAYGVMDGIVINPAAYTRVLLFWMLSKRYKFHVWKYTFPKWKKEKRSGRFLMRGRRVSIRLPDRESQVTGWRLRY